MTSLSLLELKHDKSFILTLTYGHNLVSLRVCGIINFEEIKPQTHLNIVNRLSQVLVLKFTKIRKKFRTAIPIMGELIDRQKVAIKFWQK